LNAVILAERERRHAEEEAARSASAEARAPRAAAAVSENSCGGCYEKRKK